MSSQDPSSWTGVWTVAAAGAFGALISMVKRGFNSWLRIKEKQAGLNPSSMEEE